jgi:Domain of unknown function (DUF4129)
LAIEKLIARSRTFSLWATVAILTASSAQAQPDENRVRDELRKVFERSEFNPESKQLNWSWFRRLFEWLGSLRDAAPLFYWMLLLTCVGLLLAVLYWLARTIWRAVYVSRDDEQDKLAESKRRQQSARFRAEADEHARAGDFTAAVRCLFLSLVYAFDESRRFLFLPALTNHEYLEGFADRPALKRGLQVFVDVLDRNWYGQQLTAAAEYQECLTLHEQLRQRT